MGNPIDKKLANKKWGLQSSYPGFNGKRKGFNDHCSHRGSQGSIGRTIPSVNTQKTMENQHVQWESEAIVTSKLY